MTVATSTRVSFRTAPGSPGGPVGELGNLGYEVTLGRKPQQEDAPAA